MQLCDIGKYSCENVVPSEQSLEIHFRKCSTFEQSSRDEDSLYAQPLCGFLLFAGRRRFVTFYCRCFYAAIFRF